MFLGFLWTRIDLLLGGGLREGQLTELVGPSSSGKTQVSNFPCSNIVWVDDISDLKFPSILKNTAININQTVKLLCKLCKTVEKFIWVLLSLLKHSATVLRLLHDHRKHLLLTSSILNFSNVKRNFRILIKHKFMFWKCANFLVMFRSACLLLQILHRSTWVLLYT